MARWKQAGIWSGRQTELLLFLVPDGKYSFIWVVSNGPIRGGDVTDVGLWKVIRGCHIDNKINITCLV